MTHNKRRFPKGPVNMFTGEFKNIGPFSGRINRNGGIIKITSSNPDHDPQLLQQFFAGQDWRLLKNYV